jgi:hypothetical protein
MTISAGKAGSGGTTRGEGALAPKPAGVESLRSAGGLDGQASTSTLTQPSTQGLPPSPLGIQLRDVLPDPVFGPDLLEMHRSRRAERYRLRNVAAKISTSDRLRACGRSVIADDGVVSLFHDMGDDGRRIAGVHGVLRCKLKHLCPDCAAWERHKLANEVDDYGRRWLNNDGRLWMTVFTFGGIDGEAIEDATNEFKECWRTMWAGRWATDFKRRFGLVGMIRTPEWTVRLDGSGHPHMNALSFHNVDLQGAERSAWLGLLLIRWKAVCEARGRTVNLMHAIRTQEVALNEQGTIRTVAEYIGKGGESWFGAGSELLRHDIKRSRTEHTFAPFDLLRYLVATGDGSAVYAWRAYERATFGLAARVFPGALKKIIDTASADGQLDLPTMSDDAEHVPSEQGDDIDDIRPDTSVKVAEVEPQAWHWIDSHGLVPAVLCVVEEADPPDVVDCVRHLLQAHGAPRHVLNGVYEPPSAGFLDTN